MVLITFDWIFFECVTYQICDRKFETRCDFYALLNVVCVADNKIFPVFTGKFPSATQGMHNCAIKFIQS